MLSSNRLKIYNKIEVSLSVVKLQQGIIFMLFYINNNGIQTGLNMGFTINNALIFNSNWQFTNKRIINSCQKLKVPNSFIFATWWYISNLENVILENMTYQKSTNLGCKDMGIKKFEFVTKTFLNFWDFEIVANLWIDF